MKPPVPIVYLETLMDDLIAAGLTVNGLGMTDGDLYTYDENGERMELSKAQQAVVLAHTPRAPVPAATKHAVLMTELKKPGGTLKSLKDALLAYLEDA